MKRESLIEKIKRGIIVYRGEAPKNNYGFASDPGDFGRGIYYSTSIHVAKSYGNIIKRKINFENPFVICEECAYLIAEGFGTLRGNIEERMKNAFQLTLYLLERGYDGFVSIRKRNKTLEIVDYRPYKNLINQKKILWG